MPAEYDPYLGGRLDDGSAEGALAVKQKLTDLVRVPLVPQMLELQVGGGASAINFIGNQEPSNPDLTGSVVSVKVDVATPANPSYAWLRWPVWGRVVGVSWNPMKFQPSQADLGCIIDGMAFPLPSTVLEPDTQQPIAASGFETNHGLILADNLPFGRHVVELYFTNNYSPITAQSSVIQWEIYGFIAERAGGYRERGPFLTYSKPVTLGTAETYAVAQAEAINGAHGVRKILFCNTSAAAGGQAATVFVIIGMGGSTQFAWIKTIQPQDSAELDFGKEMNVFDNIGSVAYEIGMYASVAGIINATTIGGL